METVRRRAGGAIQPTRRPCEVARRTPTRRVRSRPAVICTVESFGENFCGDFFGRAHGGARSGKTFDGDPGGAFREGVVHCGGLFQVAQAGFQQILLRRSVTARGFLRDEFLGFASGNAQVQDEVFAGQAVNSIFEVLNPFEKRGAPAGSDAGGLMGEVRSDVAIGENNLAVAEGGFEFSLGFEAVAGVEQSREMWVDGFQCAKIAVEELADHLAKPGFVLRESRGVDHMAPGPESVGKQFDLGALAATVDAFDSDQFSESRHSLW